MPNAPSPDGPGITRIIAQSWGYASPAEFLAASISVGGEWMITPDPRGTDWILWEAPGSSFSPYFSKREAISGAHAAARAQSPLPAPDWLPLPVAAEQIHRGTAPFLRRIMHAQWPIGHARLMDGHWEVTRESTKTVFNPLAIPTQIGHN